MVGNPVLCKPKSENKSTHRRLRLLMVILLCFMSWAGVTLWDQFGKLHAKADQVSALQGQLTEAKKQSEDAKREIVRLNDKEYIEQKIRKELHYTRPGETMFFTPKTSP